MSDDDNRHPHLRIVREGEQTDTDDQPKPRDRIVVGAWSNIFSLRDQVALVVGVGSDLGGAVAVALADFGARVAVADRDLDAAKRTARLAARPRQPGSIALRLDLADANLVRRAIAAVERIAGRIDILVATAGIEATQSAGDLPAWRDAVTTSLFGAMSLARQTGDGMATRGGGRILLLGPTGTGANDPTLAAIASGGLTHLVKALAERWPDQGVTINGLLVPVLATGELGLTATSSQPPEEEPQPPPESTIIPLPPPNPTSPAGTAPVPFPTGDDIVVAQEPIPRDQLPDPNAAFPSGAETNEPGNADLTAPQGIMRDIAGTAVFLCSPVARSITGQALNVADVPTTTRK